MTQSRQDDLFTSLETFAEKTYIFLCLLAQKRNLTEEEVYILDNVTEIKKRLIS